MAYTITIDSNGGVAQNGYGYNGADGCSRFAIPFTTTDAGTVSAIAYSARKVGSPSDDSKVGLMADSAGAPSNTYLDFGTNAGSGMSTSCGDFTATFSGPVSLSASTQYWVVFDRTGSTDANNRYIACGSASPAAGGLCAAGPTPTVWSTVVCGGSCPVNYAQMTVTTTAGPANVKTKDGVTQSTGIKTYEGVALASVKTVEGVS